MEITYSHPVQFRGQRTTVHFTARQAGGAVYVEVESLEDYAGRYNPDPHVTSAELDELESQLEPVAQRAFRIAFTEYTDAEINAVVTIGRRAARIYQAKGKDLREGFVRGMIARMHACQPLQLEALASASDELFRSAFSHLVCYFDIDKGEFLREVPFSAGE